MSKKTQKRRLSKALKAQRDRSSESAFLVFWSPHNQHNSASLIERVAFPGHFKACGQVVRFVGRFEPFGSLPVLVDASLQGHLTIFSEIHNMLENVGIAWNGDLREVFRF